jgi:hypothetical protein
VITLCGVTYRHPREFCSITCRGRIPITSGLRTMDYIFYQTRKNISSASELEQTTLSTLIFSKKYIVMSGGILRKICFNSGHFFFRGAGWLRRDVTKTVKMGTHQRKNAHVFYWPFVYTYIQARKPLVFLIEMNSSHSES